jgi:hypothetical protein
MPQLPAKLQCGALRKEGGSGSYELERLVGRGGMDAVYLAHRAAGQRGKTRDAATGGLALLPAATPATVPSRIRRQLQTELAE